MLDSGPGHRVWLGQIAAVPQSPYFWGFAAFSRQPPSYQAPPCPTLQISCQNPNVF
jgi:hypothetical protein